MSGYFSFLQNPSWDTLFLLLVAALGFFWGLAQGTKKMILVFLAFYVSRVLSLYVSLDTFTAGQSIYTVALIRAAILVVLAGVIYVILNRRFRVGYGGTWFSVLLLSLLLAGFVGAALFQFVTPEVIQGADMSQLTEKLFGNPVWVRWWMIAPLLGIIFL